MTPVRNLYPFLSLSWFVVAGLYLSGCGKNPDSQAETPTKTGPTSSATPNPSPEPQIVHAHTNRLIHEKSPYLQQHAHNPVDWFPWGTEAFEKARNEKKPIFLSIGYSTCHWCHVMERESFEDEKVAAFLNEHFVCIKIDREERPDVDKIYMTAVQALTGQGGWPLNVFLTPELKPFFGGTYFPPRSQFGRPSFQDILTRISEFWTNRHDDILAQAEELTNTIKSLTARAQSGSDGTWDPKLIPAAAAKFKLEYDPKNGGFGSAPKFPRVAQPSFLLHYGVTSGDQEAIQMVVHTLEKMAAGGMYDQLGGGFARYSVDAQWLVPHFEKMLYDNAQLLGLYLDGFALTGRKEFAETAADIVRYVLRDMTHENGGFFSAEDADSEGHEGKFYCWTEEELQSLLTPEEFQVAKRYYGLTPEGNFVDHSHPTPLQNQNVLGIVDGSLDAAEKSLLDSANKKMFEKRTKRIRPHLDDKILTSWNGLMVGPLARAGRMLDRPDFLVAAEKNLAFIRRELWDATSSKLAHRWKDGEKDSAQLLDDYAYLLEGVLQCYEATLKADHLAFAVQLADAMVAQFHDAEQGGFFQSAAEDDLLVRVKEDYDGAEPSGNAVATLALLKLSTLTDRSDFRGKAEGTLQLFRENLTRMPQAVPYLLKALDFSLHVPHRLVLTGKPDSPATLALLKASHLVYQPHLVRLGTEAPAEEFAQGLASQSESRAYLCTGTECKAPTTEAGEIRELITASLGTEASGQPK